MIQLQQMTTLLGCLLLERSTVIVCSNLGVLTAIMLALIPLLKPFQWQGPFIPLLPNILSDCLQAPVPYLIGVQKISPEERTEIEAVIMNVDEQHLQLVEELPPLPEKKKLEAALDFYTKNLYIANPELRKKAMMHPYKHSSEELKLVSSIIEEIRLYNTWLCEGITSLIPSKNFDVSKPSNQFILQEGVSNVNREFVKQLILSQHFMLHIDDFREAINEYQPQNYTAKLLEKLNAMLANESAYQRELELKLKHNEEDSTKSRKIKEKEKEKLLSQIKTSQHKVQAITASQKELATNGFTHSTYKQTRL